jgi:hypothetical protein
MERYVDLGLNRFHFDHDLRRVVRGYRYETHQILFLVPRRIGLKHPTQ